MKDLIQIATAELGVKEISGEGHNPVIVKYAQESGFTNITDDEVPWCSIFVNWCCMKAGLQRTHKANARSWLYIGKPIEKPNPGDIVILWRENPNSWKGHVGIVIGFSKDSNLVFVLGGNQRNSVSIQAYETNHVLGYRKLSSEGNLEIPKPILKIGSQNEEVMKLQKILHELDFDCGSIDGVFGPRTERMLKGLQKQELLQEDGIYDEKMKTALEKIYQR